MQENKEKWMKLCEQVSQRTALIVEINVLLETKEQRMEGKVASIRPLATPND